MKVIVRWSAQQPSEEQQAALLPLMYPLQPLPRVAILEPGFRRERGLRVFPLGFGPAVESYQPEALAATLDTLRPLAQSIRSGQTPPLRLRHACVVFSDAAQGLMTPHDRDLFWNVFQVPVFEQYYSNDGVVLADECEAHDGLHLRVPETVLPAPRRQTIQMEAAACGCGRTQPRVSLETSVVPIRRYAAGAR